MARKNKSNQINDIVFEIEFTYDDYLAMHFEDKKQVYFALFAWFNNQGIAMGIPRKEVFEFTLAKTIREEAFEFSAILRDFNDYFNEEL